MHTLLESVHRDIPIELTSDTIETHIEKEDTVERINPHIKTYYSQYTKRE